MVKSPWVNTVLTIAAFAALQTSFCQLADPVLFSLQHAKKEEVVLSSSAISGPSNEGAFLGTGLLTMYQAILSSQDAPSCVFRLSCSNFAKFAVRHKGLIVGSLLAADRLQRCHEFAGAYYEFDLQGTAIDPVIDAIVEKE